jgi:hypothetical protein
MSAIFIARTTQVAARSLDGEMMIMSARDSTLFTLNPVATLIWQCADGETALGEIVEQKICAEFDVAPDEAFRDAETFVKDLASHGILAISDEPIGAAKLAEKGEQ